MSSNSTVMLNLPVSFVDWKIYFYGAVIWFITIAALSWLWMRESPNTKEPPSLSPKVPFIGHLLGMIQHQAEYFIHLSTRQSWPIVTLKIFSSRIYVITSPELVQAVFRNSSGLSFHPIAIKGVERVIGYSKETIAKISAKPLDSKVETFTEKISLGMHASMQASGSLLQMNSRALNQFSTFLNEIGPENKTLDLYRWVRDSFVLASMEAIYGSENPIAEDHSLIQSLEDFEAQIGLLYLNVWPAVTARKGYEARLAMKQGFVKYYARGLFKRSSNLIQGRYRDLTDAGLTEIDMATTEIGVIMAATMNTIHGAFWLLCHVLSDPLLTSSLRSEILQITTRRTVNGIEEVCLDVSQLQNSCPLLASTWQETLRVDNAVVSQRIVMEDTLLNSTYFLKKDSLIQIPSRILNESSEIWGEDSHVFNARRFLKSNMENFSRDQKKLQKQGFVPFGGGTNLCPGRHFATVETLGVAAIIILGYDLEMADGSGLLKVPKGKKQDMGVAVKIPESTNEVSIKRKKEFEGVRWTFDVGGPVDDSDMVF